MLDDVGGNLPAVPALEAVHSGCEVICDRDYSLVVWGDPYGVDASSMTSQHMYKPSIQHIPDPASVLSQF